MIKMQVKFVLRLFYVFGQHIELLLSLTEKKFKITSQ